jgi:hypothetical protein
MCRVPFHESRVPYPVFRIALAGADTRLLVSVTLGLRPAKGHEKTPHPTSSLGHLLPREKAEVIFPLRGERVAAMRRRVRGFSTPPSRSHRSADRSTPHSLMLGPFGVADSPNQESAPAGGIPIASSQHPRSASVSRFLTPDSRFPHPASRIPCPVSLIPRKDFLCPSSNKP